MQISTEIASKCSMVMRQHLVQVMAGRRADAKPLPEPMMTQSAGAYMHHRASMDSLTGP